MKTQFLNTYRVECHYANYPNETEIYYYCDDEPSNAEPSEELLQRFYEDAGEFPTVKVVDVVCNSFTHDEYLSDDAIDLLNGGYYYIKPKKCKKLTPSQIEQFEKDWGVPYVYEESADVEKEKEYKNLFIQSLTEQEQKMRIGYISFICESFTDGEEMRNYKRNLVSSLIKHVKCHSTRINKRMLGLILNYLGESLNEEESVKHQLHLLLDEEQEREKRYSILCQLTTKDQVPYLRDVLIKLNKRYHLARESKQKIVGAVLLLFSNKYSHFLPTIEGKFSTIVKLISDYYGINPPQYRENVLYDFKDKDWDKYFKNSNTPQKDRTFINRISKIDSSFWNSL